MFGPVSQWLKPRYPPEQLLRNQTLDVASNGPTHGVRPRSAAKRRKNAAQGESPPVLRAFTLGQVIKEQSPEGAKENLGWARFLRRVARLSAFRFA
jgi:hypothetical protein